MKNIKTGLLAITLICIIASCKKPGNNTSPGSWQVTLDSVSFSGSYSNITYSTTDKNLVINLSDTVNSYPHLLLQGSGPNGTADILAGSYNFGITYGYTLQCDSTAGLTFLVRPGNGGYGLFNISDFDLKKKLISGTFNFIAPLSPAGGDTLIGNGTITNLPIDVTL